MFATSVPPLAFAAFPWVNLFWVLAGTTVFLCLLAVFGRFLAATHPDPVVLPDPVPVASTAALPIVSRAVPQPGVSPEVTIAITAAVSAVLGQSVRVVAIHPAGSPLVIVENIMLTWSLEGRREIYNSHRVR